MPNFTSLSSVSLVIVMKQEAKEEFSTVEMFAILYSTEIISSEIGCFSKIYYHRSFQSPKLCIAYVVLTSNVCACSILVLLIEGN
jgi:hypothetical protein